MESDMFPTIIIVFSLVSLVLLLYWHRSSFQNFLRGLWNLLYVCALFTRIPNYKAMDIFFKWSGPLVILRLPFFRKPYILVGDLILAKKITAAWGNRFPDDYFLSTNATSSSATTDNQDAAGLVWSNGEGYRANRAFIMKMLTTLEFYSIANIELSVKNEVEEVNKRLRSIAGGSGSFAPRFFYQLPSSNITFRAMFGQRFDPEDEKMSELMESINTLLEDTNMGASLLELFPGLRHLPGIRFLPGCGFPHKFQRFYQVLSQYIQTEILDKRRQLGKYKVNPQDLADYYLLQIDQDASRPEPRCFTDLSMKVVWRDMFIGGSETLGKTLEWATLFMALNPNKQAKLHQEVDAVVGTARFPAYADKKKMPYTEATILEVLRLGSIGPAIARSPVSDTKLAGQDIPKDSPCGISIYAIHRSEQVWEDPRAFRPERFLSEDGMTVLRANKDKIMPFGYVNLSSNDCTQTNVQLAMIASYGGTRVCLGKYLATVSLFIFFASIMQHYEFSMPPDLPAPQWRSEFGISRSPPPFHVTVKSRDGFQSDHLP